MSDKTAVYLRVSTDAQSVESERGAIEDRLAHDGIAVPDDFWFIDEGESRATFDRPAFKRLQAAVFGADIDTVYMFDLTRFCGTMIDGVVEIDRWQKLKVRIVLVADGLDIQPDTWFGEIMLKLIVCMKLAFSEQERQKIRERCAAGRKYTVPKKKKQAMEMAAAGRTNEQIAEILKVSLRTVPLMLDPNRQTYCGGSRWGGRPTMNGTSAQRVLELMVQKLTNDEIKNALGIKERTFRSRIQELGGMGMAKMKAWEIRHEKRQQELMQARGAIEG